MVEDKDNYSRNKHLPGAAMAEILTVTSRIISDASCGLEHSAMAIEAQEVASS